MKDSGLVMITGRVTLGARWLFIIWKFISHPLFQSSFALVLTLSLSQMGMKKLLLNFLTSQQKKKISVYFCLPTQLLPWCLGSNIPLLYMRASLKHLFFLLVGNEQGPAESQWQGRARKVESQMRSRCAGNQFHGVWFCKAACWRRLS